MRTEAVALLALACAAPAAAQTPAASAEEMFRLHSGSVAKVEVYESGATAPTAVGTAFFVGDGRMATNYHVVRDVVYDPDDFALTVVLGSGERVPASVVDVSAPDDLALVEVAAEAVPLAVRAEAPPRGTRLYSFGHPADLAQSVVEGNFNGAVEHRVSARYHFTGSLNPGMSGGPALTADGSVVGMNVATAGNQLSFLVPGEAVAAMLERWKSGDDDVPVLERVRAQFAAAHDEAVTAMLAEGLPTRELGGYVVPWGDEAVFDCSATTITDADDLYTARRNSCSADDAVLVTQESSLELIGFTHFTLESERLNALRFHTIYSSFFQNIQGWLYEESDDTIDYDCETANVDQGSVKLRVVFCARGNERLEGLRDIFVRTAILGDERSGIVSTLTMAGVPMETARRFVSAYLGSFGRPQ
jgi:hypothetical protein